MRNHNLRKRRESLDFIGAGLLSVLLSAIFGIGIILAAPDAGAEKDKKTKPSGDSATIVLDKKFKGNLPITELTADEATLHALNRLGYGPRPGDIERIRQMGLEKWIDYQLHPDSIDDSALDQRLENAPRRIPASAASSKEGRHHERGIQGSAEGKAERGT